MDATANEPMGFLREYLYIAKMYMIYIFLLKWRFYCDFVQIGAYNSSV